MGIAAIVAMWLELFEQVFIPSATRGSIWNLFIIGPEAFEMLKMFATVKL